ncbi:Bifunctional F420 biosynthesis protein FbiB [Candidatus Lokiarchaeum ossiferum]|uniref:Bifunctional F420 biosynthesis protein FbiB n=1 Tax=Candidatus Lokiarchaeum ossiferum TaxID=2951803 RepID=A0ABY6HUP7_9ARCH|nr:Bifunctional F420 biosynthesis protein FbiB [Candidatus Lokiarchaeum sp. B-35]
MKKFLYEIVLYRTIMRKSDIYSIIDSRRTVRQFEEKNVSNEIITKIISAGMKAPSNDHLRNWHFIVVSDQEVRKGLVGERGENLLKSQNARALVDDWGLIDEFQVEMFLHAIPLQAKMILTAGALIIPCFFQDHNLLEPKELSDLNEFASIWLCIENILLAAASEGIQGVTRIPNSSAVLKEILGVPKEYEIPCILALGYPKKGIKLPSQHELQLDNHIHRNSW